MYGAGADVIYHAAGGSGGGLFEAAKEASEASADDSQVWAIGVDSDQYNIVDASLQPYILTSMLKKVEVAVFDTIKRFTEGEAIGGAVTVYDLSAGGVDYATSGGFVDDIKDQLEDLKQQIIDGEIEVPTTP
jgi:basic membrane protein A and related proteins